jgi:hypothetical protein
VVWPGGSAWNGPARRVKPEQSNDGADQTFGLPQRQAKHQAHRQGRADRKGRVSRLTSRRGSRPRPPRRYRLIRKPNGQATPPPQGSVIHRPVRDAISGLWGYDGDVRHGV